MSLLVLLAAVALPATAADHLKVEQVSETVYVVRPIEGDTVAVSNAAFVLLPDRVVIFDTLSSRELFSEMLRHVGKVTKRITGMVVLSHWHPDHARGLELFSGRPHTLIAAPGVADRINESRSTDFQFLEKQERQLEDRIGAAVDSDEANQLAIELRDVRTEMHRLRTLVPVETKIEVTRKMQDMSMGDQVIFLQRPGPGHTAHDVMLYVVKDKVLLAGDLLNVRTLPNLSDAYTGEWMERLDELSQMNVEKIVPGHGPVGTREDVLALRGYLAALREMVRPVASSGTMRDLVEKLRLPAEYSTWDAQDLWFPGTLRVFHEMRDSVPPAAP